MKTTGRKSTNIIDARDLPDPVSKTLMSPGPIDKLPIPKNYRTGTLEIGMDDDSANGPGNDAPFLKHKTTGY